MRLSGKNVVVGVCGGIAAYKTCQLVSMLVKEGANVRVMMTKNATKFIAPLTFETLSKNRVIYDMFARDFPWEVEHISWAKFADLVVVAPMTANVAAKIANGIADDFLTTTLMAVTCPILLAPAMNTNMFTSRSYTANAKILQERGCEFIEGGSGMLACGDVGKGRMAEPQEIFDRILKKFAVKNDYCGKTVLVTAGGTSEPIDPVRYITNKSSGKMGCAIAERALRRGANVILVCGNMSVEAPSGVRRINVLTTKEMHDAVIDNLPQSDVIIKSAAPADYAVKNVCEHKIKDKDLTLELVKNPDIAATVGKNKGDKKLVIFCAETNDLIKNAKKKLATKNADMVVANDVTLSGAGFGVDTNIVSIITNNEQKDLPVMSKTDLADKILDEIIKL